MGDNSSIEWTDASWNPVRGCVKVSPGCKHCYAETFAERFRGVPGHPYEQGFDPRLVPQMLDQPLRWKKPRKIFVNSMSDLFGDFVPDDYLRKCFDVMECAYWHQFQVLTKRAERMPEFCRDYFAATSPDGVTTHEAPPHIWLGVSVEDRKYGLPRIEHLRRTPAAVRFVSIEPLLEDIAADLDLREIQWCIIGGESGQGARPFNLDWARKLIAVCRRDGCAPYFKQAGARPIIRPGQREWGAWDPALQGKLKRTWADDKGRTVPEYKATDCFELVQLRSSKGGDLSELPEDLRVREFPTVRA